MRALKSKLHPSHDSTLTRRDVIKEMGRGVVALPAVYLIACGGSGPTNTGGESAGDTGIDAGIDAGIEIGMGAGSETGAGAGTSTEIARWAGGGTAAMTGTDRYPDPFTSGLADHSCQLIGQLTLGPCYAPTAPVRQDVSEGELGVPVRLALRAVELEGCAPVSGAEIEIWYCNVEGRYSGSDVNRVEFCTGGDERAEAAYYARGRALTSEEGVAYFDCTFPGWYPGRAVHIHFLIRRPEYVGGVQDTEAAVVSQVFFPEALTAEICDQVAVYQGRGQPDTTFDTDGVLRDVRDISPFLVGYQRMDDGAMLAWKTIALA